VRVSVVIPTYRRAESLARCLDALDRQERVADETLVVVRDEDTASQAVAAGRARPVRVVTVSRPGVVAAMNAGIDASSGDVVALTDDDAAPHADWLARMLAVYEADAAVAATGGRDWVHTKRGGLKDGSASTVGAVSWFGRVTGNHHLGVGGPREVDALKGVNLSVKGALLRELRIDERLRGVGTEHHWELALCLALRARGMRIVYDPAIAVEHYPQPRVDDSREFSAAELRDATFNEALALLEYLPAWGRAGYVAWAFAVGTRTTPGVAQALRLTRSRGAGAWRWFFAAQAGLLAGLAAFWRSRRAGSPV
jgi:glycosyltransferase involved in cell wall biosynthesis